MQKSLAEKIRRRKTILAIVVAIVLTPLTLALGSFLGDRHYYLCSVLIVIYSLVPFYISFENKKPQARELVVIAILCGLAAVSRIAFIWVPHFNPSGAIVIIAAIVFGPQAGFLTGSLSIFVSNFLCGQGAWTPWQMFAFGFLGFVFGLIGTYTNIPKHSYTKKQLFILSLCGALSIILVVGSILDTCSLFIMSSEITVEVAIATYASGFPVNCVHASAVFITLLFATNPLLEKLQRVKVKYGFKG